MRSLWPCLLLLLSLLGGSAQGVKPDRGVFETCPACRLSAMPELKKFLHESVLKNEYGEKLTVNFIFGKTPTLILYDSAGKEISATEVDATLNYDALHKWVQGLGFVKQPAAQTEAAATTTAAAAATGSTAAAPPAGSLQATAAPSGPAPVPPQPQQLQQRQRRRRRRMRQRGVEGGHRRRRARVAGGEEGPYH